MANIKNSKTYPITWLPFDWADVAFFTIYEGAFWVNVTAYKPIEIHAVMLHDGREWDAINGFRYGTGHHPHGDHVFVGGTRG